MILVLDGSIKEGLAEKRYKFFDYRNMFTPIKAMYPNKR